MRITMAIFAVLLTAVADYFLLFSDTGCQQLRRRPQAGSHTTKAEWSRHFEGSGTTRLVRRLGRVTDGDRVLVQSNRLGNCDMTIHKTAVVGGIAAAGIIAAMCATGTASASCASLNGNHIGNGCESARGRGRTWPSASARGPWPTATDSGNVAISVGSRGVNNDPAYGDQPTQRLRDGVGKLLTRGGQRVERGFAGQGQRRHRARQRVQRLLLRRQPGQDNEPSRFNTSVVLGNRGNAYASDRGAITLPLGQGTILSRTTSARRRDYVSSATCLCV